jgi:hypothetical protein
MKRSFSASVTVATLWTTAIVVFPSMSKAETAPPMGGGYTDVIPIPVNDPAVKAISGALFKPTGRRAVSRGRLRERVRGAQ